MDALPNFKLVRPATLDEVIAAVHPAELAELLLESGTGGPADRISFGPRHDHADAPHAFALLRLCRQRPRRRRGAEEAEEGAAVHGHHSITSSARLRAQVRERAGGIPHHLVVGDAARRAHARANVIGAAGA